MCKDKEMTMFESAVGNPKELTSLLRAVYMRGVEHGVAKVVSKGILDTFNDWDSMEDALVRPAELPDFWTYTYLDPRRERSVK